MNYHTTEFMKFADDCVMWYYCIHDRKNNLNSEKKLYSFSGATSVGANDAVLLYSDINIPIILEDTESEKFAKFGSVLRTLVTIWIKSRIETNNTSK